MLSKNELRYTLALQRIPNLGDISAKKLLRKMGSAEAVFKEKKSNLAKIDGIGLLRLKDINLGKQLEEAWPRSLRGVGSEMGIVVVLLPFGMTCL